MSTTVTIDPDIAYELEELLGNLIGLCHSDTGRFELVLRCHTGWACGPDELKEDCERLIQGLLGAVR
ncbi:MAG: hypothetical protein M0Z93_08565 [Actinomycetota bacterium]|jgi:hypothetical protein|nr:hypothetical protein [Actinomycetota bacterium]